MFLIQLYTSVQTKFSKFSWSLVILITVNQFAQAQTSQVRIVSDFNKGWRFYLPDSTDKSDKYKEAGFNDFTWRRIALPHDWSVEGAFSEKNPAKAEGGALPGGTGWYRKNFLLPDSIKDKKTFIEFDGVYRCSDVWINGHYLGFRPNGYISFRYDLSPYLHFGSETNTIAVRVDNSKQPNSRWYSGSGIYRNVRLVTTNTVAIDQWGTYVTTPVTGPDSARVNLQMRIRNYGGPSAIRVQTSIYDQNGNLKTWQFTNDIRLADTVTETIQRFSIGTPVLWSIERPFLYMAITQVMKDATVLDEYVTHFGIRDFHFDADSGFVLNGKRMKINGVCNHHDLGALGAAVNLRAIERQLEILKSMGVNGIRTSHNPPAPELLDLCDRMGFIVMDEAFDMWKMRKSPFDYSLYWDQWHTRDLQDMIRRDRNHPSIFIWSIGNEIPEQRNPSGAVIAKELTQIVRDLDSTRPVTAANNNPDTANSIVRSGALDLMGYNYHQRDYPAFHQRNPGKPFIATETVSSLATRGHYDMPSDSIWRWPLRRGNRGRPMNADFTVSAYDHVSTPWGSTQEETWKVVKKSDFIAGQFIWTGFDYLGEPTPYGWPARSSYFGLVDLAGFPKDTYYMYQGEWTDKPVLHIFPHWNWKQGDSIDVWAYYSQADEVELFLNEVSLGTKKKNEDELHVVWKVKYAPGTLKAVSRKNGAQVLAKEIKTAGKPATIQLIADRNRIKADGKDLSFVTVNILDKDGNLVPDADNLVHFSMAGTASIAGVDNGNPVSHEPFKSNQRKAFHGKALVILQAGERSGRIVVTATSEGLPPASMTIEAR